MQEQKQGRNKWKVIARNARAKALEKLHKHREEVVYLDAAEYKVQDAFAIAAVGNTLKAITAAIVYRRQPEEV